MNTEKTIYLAQVSFKNKSPFTLDINPEIKAGRNPRSEIILTSRIASDTLFTIEFTNEVLVFKYKGPNQYLKINKEFISTNQNIFIREFDKISTPEVEIKIIKNSFKNETPPLENNIQLPINDQVNVLGFPKRNQNIHKAKTSFKVSDTRVKELKNILNSEFDDDNHDRDQNNELNGINNKKEENQSNLNKGNIQLFFLKLYSLVIDLFITYFFISFVIYTLNLSSFFIDITNFIRGFVFKDSPHSFENFLIIWYLLSIAQNIIFGCTLGQFLVGLKIDFKNSFLKYVYRRVLSFFSSLVMIPAQNSYSSTQLWNISRLILCPILIIIAIISPLFTPGFINTRFSIESFPTMGIIDDEVHIDTLLKTKDTAHFLNIPNRFIFIPNFDNKTQLNFYDIIEDEKITLTLFKSINKVKLEDQLMIGSPFFGNQNNLNTDYKLKDHITKNLTINKANFLAKLFSESLFLANSNFLKAEIFGKELTSHSINVIDYKNLNSVLKIEILDPNKPRNFFIIFNNLNLDVIEIHAPNNTYLIGELFQLMSTLNIENIDEKTLISLIDLLHVEIGKDEQSILTYYINTVNKVLASERNYKKEKLDKDIRYILSKNIEQTISKIDGHHYKQALTALLKKLTPMEMPGEQDE